MNDLAFWTAKLQETERELEAATHLLCRGRCREAVDADQSQS